MTKKCVVVFSSGMDSTVVLHHCLKEYTEVYCLTFDYNQRHRKEIDKALEYTTSLGVGEGCSIKQHIVVDLKFLSDLAPTSALTNKDINVPQMKQVIGEAQNKAHVPNRNMILLSIAASYAEANGCSEVFYGAALVDDTSGHWDGTSQFRNSLNDCLAFNRLHKVQIQAPLVKMSKKEIIEYGISLGVQFDKTWTCYEGLELSCGTCPACSARLQGFVETGYQDPLPYSKEIPWQKFNCVPLSK
jgi:7-cyano-7-deazaguanine synthase